MNENDGRFSKEVENTVGKDCAKNMKTPVTRALYFLSCPQQILLLKLHLSSPYDFNSDKSQILHSVKTLYSIDTHQQQTAFENIVGKEEIAHYEQFLLFPQCFVLNLIIVPSLSIFLTSYFYLLLNWKSPKLAYEVKG